MSTIYLVTRDFGSEGTGNWEIPFMAFTSETKAQEHAGLAELRRDELIAEFERDVKEFRKLKEQELRKTGTHLLAHEWKAEWIKTHVNEYDPEADEYERIDRGVSYGVMPVTFKG